MIDHPADLIPLWILIAGSIGFMIGSTVGDETRRRKCAEEQLEAFRDQAERTDLTEVQESVSISNSLQQTLAETQAIHKTMRRLRGAINQIHKHLLPVSKG